MKTIGELVVYNYAKDVTNQKFGRLTAIKPIRTGGRRRQVVWLWRCDCGKEVEGITWDIINGRRSSCGCARGKEPGVSSFNLLFNTYKNNAERRGKPFFLTKIEFKELTQQNCFYCNREPSQERGGKTLKKKYVYNGIDRLDSSVGYIKENCVPCCGVCNKAKMSMNYQEFIDVIESIYKHRILKCPLD